jgi:hypothetical protein
MVDPKGFAIGHSGAVADACFQKTELGNFQVKSCSVTA